MKFDELQIPPPRYWQQFEDLCLSLFRQIWDDPTAQKNGRSGQQQHGTDISGTMSGALVGVQCKGKDAGLGATVTEDELLSEVKKAKGFRPPLATWTLVTSAPKDARIEEFARQITAKHQANGLFAVRVLGWEDLLSLMARYPSVIEQHYPDLAPATRIHLARLSHDVENPTTELADEIRAARNAAKRDLENFQTADGGPKSVQLDLERSVNDRRLAISHSGAGVELRSGQPLLLEAEPGAGKSTTLIQLAASVLEESDDCVAAIVLLPVMGQRQRDLIDEIASRPVFRSIGADTLSRIAQAGRLVVLCDGWNELPTGQRDWVRTSLATFRREYPASGLLIATRALSPPPINTPLRIFLLPPSRAQQLAILSETLGPAAEELLNRAWRTPGLGDLLRTPLYVTVLAEIGNTGALPETKEQAIRRFIERQEQRPEHRTSLRDALKDRQQAYLRAAADHLMIAGTGAISQSDLRAVVGQVSAQLRAADQITILPDQQDTIDVLVSHHVLVEQPGEIGGSFHSFQHQQFREWFASFHVEERMAAASTSPSPENRHHLADILNQPDWTEAIFFAVERLSRATPDGARSVGHAISRAIAIDPMLGAAMIRRAAPEAWAHIAEPVVRFATEWHNTAEKHRAFRFMVGSGRPEFAAPVWETIGSKDGYDRSANFDFGWFALTVLGPHTYEEYAKLSDGQRRSLLWDLMRFGGQEGIELAITASATEPSAEVVQTVLDLLWFGGAHAEFYAVLRLASPDVWKLLAVQHRLSDASGKFRARLLEEKKKFAATTTSGDKFRILLELTEHGDDANPSELIELAFGVTPSVYQTRDAIFAPLASKYPEQLSQSIVDRLLRGDTLPIFAASFVGVAAAQHQESLRAIALGIVARDGRAKEIAARALNLESAKSLIRDLLALLDGIAEKAGAAPNAVRQQYQTITDALHLVHRSVFASSLLTADANLPRHIGALAELIFRWRSDDRDDASLPIDDAIRDELGRALVRWIEHAVKNPNTTRHDLSNLVTAIKRVAAPSLLPSLKRLLDADIAGWRNEQAALEQLRKERRATTAANVGYSQIYLQAIEAFQGDEVRDLLLTYIGTPEFEVEAAIGLRQYGTGDHIPSPAENLGRPKYEQILPARQRRAGDQRPVNTIAVALLDRVVALLETGRREDLGRAAGLAAAVAQMDYGDRIATINDLLAAPGPMSARYGLLLALTFAGEIVPAAYVRQGYDEALSRFNAQTWHSQNEWWAFDRWIELMAFSDAPGEIIECVKKLPDQFKHARNFDRIVYALGYIDPTQSLEVLTALAAQFPELPATHNYINACAHIGSREATQYLLTVACNPPTGAPHRHDLLGLTNVLPGLLGKHPLIARELLTRVAADRRLAASPIIAQVLPSILDEQDILMLFQAWNSLGGDPASQILERAVHDLAFQDWPIEGSAAFERQPSDLSALRSELFRIYVEDKPRAAFAANLLRIIDRQRDVYGRPLSEPRHPNLALGVPWPSEAAGLLFLLPGDGSSRNLIY